VASLTKYERSIFVDQHTSLPGFSFLSQLARIYDLRLGGFPFVSLMMEACERRWHHPTLLERPKASSELVENGACRRKNRRPVPTFDDDNGVRGDTLGFAFCPFLLQVFVVHVLRSLIDTLIKL